MIKTKQKTFLLTPDQCKDIEKRAKKYKLTESLMVRENWEALIKAIDKKYE